MNLFNVLNDRPVDAEGAEAKFVADTKHEGTHDRLVWGMRMHRDEAARQLPGWEEFTDQRTHADPPRPVSRAI